MKQLFTLPIASNATLGSAVDLGTSGFDVVYVSHRAAAEVSFLGAMNEDDTFYPIHRENSAVVGFASNTFTVGTAVTGAWVPAQCLNGLRFIKARVTATAANGANVYVATTFGR